ncbi:biofilm development YmgB/AriR family protein [Enterobacter cloacae S611]|uniref:Biofilm development YmgB/AriR family protein n=1 Tax=Enterobacter cloacae S611 TaxID=1399146 RepID=A0ABP2ZS84_ENTCL|nr:biofilm development YmgB/AriR family protein [Enterobacter cloacae S611]
MNNPTATLPQNFQSVFSVFEAEKEIIDEVTRELQAVKATVANKDIMLALIARVETETDVIRKDILRNALELVVLRTLDV